MASKTHFTVTIPSIPGHVGGTVTCTEPAPQVYLLTLASPPDNRLTPPLCAALLEALDRAEFGGLRNGVLVTTSAIPKFYSNGLDLQLAMGTPGFTEESLYPLFRRFLTYPMPTVALVNGHCFAGGLMLAMHHDYRVFGGGVRGYMAVNELEFGAPLLPPMAGIFREKLSAPVYRTLALEARRFGGGEALEAGIVDVLGGWEDGVMKLVEERKLTTKGKMGVYGMLKEEMYRGQVALLDARGSEVVKAPVLMEREKKRKVEGARRVKAKL
ncbi:Hydroxycinnamoyl-CoA hydratase-lyase [Apiospora aurea]|uniref:Hydroxycinnamoyl-CoA hydratase-lyase n=1 Tax=Apiospora aurea TaxID=335848 RepID=A0ABR1Q1B9_9PEZI